MPRKLKIWNGRGHRKLNKYHIYVAAYTQKQARELIEQACDCYISTREIPDYYNEGSWGNSMAGIEATEPCLYIDKIGEAPTRLI